MGGSAVGIGGAYALAKTAAKAPLNFYPTMAAPATPAPLSQRVGGGESVAEQLAAKPGTQLLGDMAGEMAAQMAQLAGASPLLATAAAVAGNALAGRAVGRVDSNNHFAVNGGPNGGAGRGRAREDIQPERPRKEDGEYLDGSSPQGKADGKNKATQDTSPAFAPSGPLLFEDNKWNFLYGRATGSKHNLDRTAELKKTFDVLGLPENETSKKMLLEHFNEVVSSYPVAWAKESTNLRGPTVTKISHLTGPSGRTATLEITSEVLNDGRFRFMTVVARLHS